MSIRRTLVAFCIVLLALLLAGCGGNQSGDQPKNHQSSSAKQSGKAANQHTARPAQKRTQLKTALGTISKIKLEKDRIYLRPTKGNKVTGFRIVNEPKVTLNGRKAKLTDIKKGQQAMIRYRPGKNLGRARIIQVFGGGGSRGAKGGKEKTGG